MNNYTLTPDGLVTSDPMITAMFWGWQWEGKVYRIHSQKEQFDLGKAGWCIEVTIPRRLVSEVIEPVEGEGFLIDLPANEGELKVFAPYPPMSPALGHYHKRVLNIVTTRAELRTLVAWCKERAE